MASHHNASSSVRARRLHQRGRESITSDTFVKRKSEGPQKQLVKVSHRGRGAAFVDIVPKKKG